jgi:hypothetical protein
LNVDPLTSVDTVCPAAVPNQRDTAARTLKNAAIMILPLKSGKKLFRRPKDTKSNTGESTGFINPDVKAGWKGAGDYEMTAPRGQT